MVSRVKKSFKRKQLGEDCNSLKTKRIYDKMFRTTTFTIAAVLAASGAHALRVGAANLLTTTTHAKVSHHPDGAEKEEKKEKKDAVAPEDEAVAPVEPVAPEEEAVAPEEKVACPEATWTCAKDWVRW